MTRHAGLIATRVRGVWRGVLIEGPTGAGKSDLALRALGAAFRLVADDRVSLWVCEGRLFGCAAETLSGLLEIRGLEVIQVPTLPLAEVMLVARCGTPERIPEARTADIAGVSIPLIEIDPREASAPAKLRRALTLFDVSGKRRI